MKWWIPCGIRGESKDLSLSLVLLNFIVASFIKFLTLSFRSPASPANMSPSSLVKRRRLPSNSSNPPSLPLRSSIIGYPTDPLSSKPMLPTMLWQLYCLSNWNLVKFTLLHSTHVLLTQQNSTTMGTLRYLQSVLDLATLSGWHSASYRCRYQSQKLGIFFHHEDPQPQTSALVRIPLPV